ncbi:hypothetical protein [Streptococcus suis]|uniref:hypothetical protein n=1 Tax=Streptococcus suis TaxID=1307 RepID=UPI003BA1FCF1
MRTLKSQLLLILNNRLVRIQALGLLFLLPLLILSIHTNLSERSNQLLVDLEAQAQDVNYVKKWNDANIDKFDERAVLENQGVDAFNLSLDYLKHGNYRSYLNEYTTYMITGLLIREKFYTYYSDIFNRYVAQDSRNEELLLWRSEKQSVFHSQQLLELSRDITDSEVTRTTSTDVLFSWLDYSTPGIFYVPLFFVITLLFASPIFLDDKKHKSLLEIKPISPYKYLLDKVLSYWIIITGFELMILGIILFSVSFKFGLGDLSLNILIFNGEEELMISQLEFYGKAGLFFLLINFFLTTLLSLTNFLFSSKPLSFLIGVFVLFLEPILRFLQVNPIFSDSLPTSYISFGPVLHGLKEQFFKYGSFTFEKGFVVLIVSSLFFLILTCLFMILRDRWSQNRRFVWALRR